MRNNLDRLLAAAALGLVSPAMSKPLASHRHQALHHAAKAEGADMPVANEPPQEVTETPEGAVVIKFAHHEDGRPIEAPVHLPPGAAEQGKQAPVENSGSEGEQQQQQPPASGAPQPSSNTEADTGSDAGGSGAGPGTGSLSGSGAGSSSNRTSPGIAYAPYGASGDCKTADQIAEDFAILAKQYSMVRIYGTDCDQVSKVYPVAKETGMKLFLGIFELEGVDQQVQHITKAVDGDWSMVDTVSVGNELVNNKQASASDVISAMRNVRSQLQSSGYEGPVVTVDTFMAMRDNPELCNESDYCAMNVHPFFDGNTAAEEAGPFITRMVSDVQSKLSDTSKRMVVTETGWPWQGSHNRAAVPGRNQQHTAIESIKAAFQDEPSNLILFSAFNDPWKPSAADTFFAEQYWGIDDMDMDEMDTEAAA